MHLGSLSSDTTGSKFLTLGTQFSYYILEYCCADLSAFKRRANFREENTEHEIETNS